MKKIYFLTVVLILHFSTTTVHAQPAGLCCPDIGWDYIVPITITNNTGAALPAQTTLLVINTATPIGAGKMQASGNDIRFVYNTCGNFLDYWIESGINTATTNIWIDMPAIANGASRTIYLLYGNPSAPAAAVAQTVLFPNIQTIAGAQNLSGTITADWINVNGATITAPTGAPLILQARRIIYNGTYNADNRGFGPQAGPGAGVNGGGSKGGSGGSYGGVGGSGGGGVSSVYGTANGTDINMGSGGGGSDCNASAAGGGAISLIGSSIDVNGTINVRGQNAQSCCCGNSSEAAGGGSGGGVLVQGDYLRGTGTINANGGNGGNSDDKEGGGGGGGGRVKFLWCQSNTFSGAVNVAGGSPGSGNQNGMQPGAIGTNTQPQGNACLNIAISPEQPVSLPTAGFTYNNACTGVVATFTSTSTVAPGGSISTYAWDFGDGGTASTQNPTHSFAATGTFNVSLTVTSVTGCTDVATVPVAVQQLPTADFTVNTVCSGNATSFTDASTGAPLTYSWDFGDSNTDNVQNPQHVYTTGGSYNATLIVTNSGNCGDTIQKPVTVNPGANAVFAAADVCFPNSVQFNNTSTGNIVNTGWSFGDSQVSTAQSPAHNYSAPGPYNAVLIVATANGCADTATQLVTVNPKPTADFTVPAVCEGSNSVFTDASTGTGLGWSWDFGDGSTDATQSPTHLYTTAGTYNTTLIVTNAVSCSDTIQKQAVVNANPIASFTTANVCYPAAAQFNNTSTGTIAQNGWSFGDGQISTQQSPLHGYATAGNYNVVLIVATANNCADTAMQGIVVNPHPTADFTVSPVCEGLASTFTDGSSNTGGNIIAYGWSFGDGNVSTQQSPTNTYASANTYNVTLIVQSDSSCYDTVTKQAIVNPVPNVDFTTGAVCLNQNNAFVNTTTIASGSVSIWAWDFGDTQVSSQQSPSHVYSAQGMYTVSLVAVSDNNCTDSISKTVDVFDKPVAAFTVDEVCFGVANTFADGSSIATGSISQWAYDFGDSQTGTTASGTHTYAAAGTFTAILVVTSNNGCTDTATQAAIVDPLPLVNFTAPDVCLGNTTQFANSSAIASGSITGTQWDFDDATGSTTQSPSNTYAAAGVYQVSLVLNSDKNCSDSLSKTISVFDLPTAVTASTPACFAEANGTATVTASAGTPAYNYLWSDGQTGATATNVAAGNYNVTVSDANNCTATASAVVTQPATALTVSVTPPAPSVVIGETVLVQLSNSYNDAAAVYNTTPAYGLSCTDCAQFDASPYQTTSYYVDVTDANGCKGIGQFTILVDEAIPVFVPNVFTPNGDGANDTWGIYSKSVKQISWSVFNRIGEKVFEADNLNDTWDGNYQGKPAPSGVYVYKGYVVYLNDKTRQLKGGVTLVR